MINAKFRALYDGGMVYNAVRLRNGLYWDDGGDVCFDLMAFVQDNPAILMQCTGLRDKNNIEIYEGDIIVKFNLRDLRFRSVVMRHLGAFGYMGYVGDFIAFASNYNFDWMDGKSMKIEVLGNIHENPEINYQAKGRYLVTR